jgi:hypothetical protein
MWNDGNTQSQRTITVISDTTFTAIFEITHTVTVLENYAERGTVTGSGEYPQDSTATITATANNGHRFLMWNDGNTESPRTVTVISDITYTAIFEIMHTVTVLANYAERGTVTGSGEYPQDSTATITATANNGHRFLMWNDGNTESPRTVTIISDTTFTAIFEIMHTVTVAANYAERGTVTGSGEYPQDSTATITATPNIGYHFVEWNDGNTTNPREFTVTGDTTFTAIFDITNAIEDMETSTISIYPNPATDNIHIVLPEHTLNALFTLYDVQGRALIRKNISNRDVVSVEALASGIYLYSVKTEKQSYQGKIMK